MYLLKMRGPQNASTLGTALGTTDEAARQQLVKLSKDGVIESVSQTRGVGRPSLFWQLTPKGHARFPDAHAALTVQLINAIEKELGADALERLIAAREIQTRAEYQTQFSGLEGSGLPLEEKVARLAAIRSSEGYMAEYQPQDDGFLLVENHCPIAAAAATCQGFCRAELNVFQEVLGPDVKIERVEHIPAGARRCAYRIVAI
ncbi:transcriptional regulator [bacterium]|nr:MAG: transcriptional regulator [bacterium]